MTPASTTRGPSGARGPFTAASGAAFRKPPAPGQLPSQSLDNVAPHPTPREVHVTIRIDGRPRVPALTFPTTALPVKEKRTDRPDAFVSAKAAEAPQTQ